VKKFPSGAAIEVFETLDSTSLEARRRIEAGETGPCWIIALQQTAGYGRRGRGWVQQTGDFAGTLLIRPEAPLDRLGQLSFVSALAAASALDEIISPDRISLKWPNDVLLDGKKAAGILLEHIAYQGQARLAIGIGLNIVSAPQGLPYPTARLVDYTADVPSPPALAARIDDHFWRYYREWSKNGFSQIRSFWMERAKGVGEEVTVRLPNEEICGVCDGIDETGAMILRLGSGKRIISAGDVFF
jgi:BirA family transcriptional regulator, biotin operon repressor / biotin---[acetyl-CoA-carboxylase] ligase